MVMYIQKLPSSDMVTAIIHSEVKELFGAIHT
jgi:hypothetical protein